MRLKHSTMISNFVVYFINYFTMISIEFSSLAFALGIITFLNAGFFEAFMFILKFLILSLSLQILYGWIYVINEFVAKYEPPELRTIRFNKVLTIKDVIISFLVRSSFSQLLLLIGISLSIFNPLEYYWITVLWILLIILMISHQVLSWEIRSLSTLPLLRIIRILYVFLPIRIEPLERYWIFVYAFTITLPHLLNYFGSKLLRSTLKVSHHIIVFSRRTWTTSKKLLQAGIIFSASFVLSLLIFDNVKLFKMVIYPILMIVALCIYGLIKKSWVGSDNH